MSNFRHDPVLYQTHPAMFRKHPILFLVCLALVMMYGIGLLLLLIWWTRVSFKTLTITRKRVIYKEGFFSNNETEIPHSQIGTIQIHQNFWEHIFGVGTIEIAAAGTSGYELKLSGMPEPVKIQHLIDANQY